MVKSRAIVTAPVARDLLQEAIDAQVAIDIVRVPGASNGTLQAWDTLDQGVLTAYAATDPALTVYPTFQSLPLALKKFVIQVYSYNSAAAVAGTRALKRAQDCTAADWIKVTNGGVASVKQASALVAGDRPTEWEPMHSWSGNVLETLGVP